MATQTIQPPLFLGSVSGSANTASSWSRASAGSMVISGSSRRSVRPCRVGSSPARASASAASENPMGMPWVWMAISEAARGSSSRPTTSSTRPGREP